MHKKHKLWRVVTIVATYLAVIAIIGTGVAQNYSAMINSLLRISTSTVVSTGSDGNAQYYVSDYDTFAEMHLAKMELIRQIAQEGTVLLKNNGALPIESGKVAVFGANDFVIQTVSFGGGYIRGTMQPAGLLEALRFDGLTVVTDDADASGSDAAIVVLGRAQGEGSDLPIGSLTLTGEELNRIESAKAASNKVILLLSGEYSLEIAELAKDDRIDAILRFGNAGYRGAYGLADVITGKATPSGRLVETMAADSLSAPSVMNWGDLIYSNGNSVMASQAKNYVVYAEGIYTDYRYYETRYEDAVLGQGGASSATGAYASESGWNYSDEVIYPYGYGLSYTTFTHELAGEPIFNDDHSVTVRVNVTNTGSVAGKEVVQVYAQAPYTDYDIQNKVEKSSVALMGFAKTDVLQPGETTAEPLEITLHLQWLASYDYTTAKTYIMDAGDYYLTVADNAHDAVNNILAAKGKTTEDGMTAPGNTGLTYTWHQDSLDTTTYAHSLYTGVDITNSFEDADLNYWMDDSDKITYLSRNAWDATYPQTVSLTANKDMLSSLNDTKKYENGVWNDSASRIEIHDVNYVDIVDANGLSSIEEVKKAIDMRGLAYDDVQWEAVLDNLTIYEISSLVSDGIAGVQPAPSVGFPGGIGNDGPIGLVEPYKYSKVDKETGEKTELTTEYAVKDQFSDEEHLVTEMSGTMFPSETVFASSFNVELSRRQGEFYGEDGLYAGVSYMFALGLNMHRAPFGGRHAEYFSADPVQNSFFGIALSEGCREKGVVLVAKHFAVNEQEQNRIGVATFVNEQALREVYLRAFEGPATYGQLQGLMTSYNRLGLIGAASEYDLLAGVLRGEWGNQCYIITDCGAPTAGLYDGNAQIVAGCTVMLNNGTYNATSGSHVNKTLNVESIKADPVLLQACRDAVHRTLYNFIHSNAVNGIAADTQIVMTSPWWQTALTVADIGFTVVAVAAAGLYLVFVNKKEDAGQ